MLRDAVCPIDSIRDGGGRPLGLRGRLLGDGHARAEDVVLQDKALLTWAGTRTRLLPEDVGDAIALRSAVID